MDRSLTYYTGTYINTICKHIKQEEQRDLSETKSQNKTPHLSRAEILLFHAKSMREIQPKGFVIQYKYSLYTLVFSAIVIYSLASSFLDAFLGVAFLVGGFFAGAAFFEIRDEIEKDTLAAGFFATLAPAVFGLVTFLAAAG
jgi:hypothetical protein